MSIKINIIIKQGNCYVYSFFTVPVPHMDFISNVSNPVLSGTSLTLICIVAFHPAVDLPVEVDIQITSPDRSIINDGRNNLTRRMPSLYVSKVVLSSIGHEDAGIYTCSVTTGREKKISEKEIQIG